MFVGEAEALDACEKLIDLHAWSSGKIDPEGWLNNFDTDERRYAAHMLGRFTFFSDKIVNALFLSAFHGLSNNLRLGRCSRIDANLRWNEFLNCGFVTIVQGESPNPSDSGYFFARKARQVLGMSEDQLLTPDSALEHAADGFIGPIVFVDDFVGSGAQFLKTFRRKRPIAGHGRLSFADLPIRTTAPIIYCNAILTELGRENILAAFPRVILATGNILPTAYSWVDKSSLLWPEHERENGIAFIRRMSERIGLADDHGSERDWRGFAELGLGLAFEHSTPDATLPLFHWDENWCPLVKRS